ncbi:hypothetical protein GCM10028805_57870 [Spirosoma harenae]
MLKRLSPDNPVTGSHSVALPHRDKHYMLLIIDRGKLVGTIDFEQFTTDGPFLLLVFPGQIHLLTPETPLSGWIIDFNSAVIDAHLQSELELYRQNPLQLQQPKSTVAFEQIKKLLAVLEELFRQPWTITKAIVALFTGMLHIITYMASSLAEDGKVKKSRPQLIKRQFLALLHQHYRDWKKPSRYAEKLSISTAHLNDTIKQLTGRTATAVIQEHCIQEAQRLLRYTDLSVKEISYQLGYPNPSHFIAIFSTRLGATPLQYRRQPH